MKSESITFTLTHQNSVEVSEALGRVLAADNFFTQALPGKVLAIEAENKDPYMINVSVSTGEGLVIEHIGDPELPTILIPLGSEVVITPEQKTIIIHTHPTTEEVQTVAYLPAAGQSE